MDIKKARILIYGAGRGSQMVAEILNSNLDYQVTGLIDDNPDLWGEMIAGLNVLGGKDAILNLWREGGFDKVVISIATPATMHVRRELYFNLKNAGIAFANAIHSSAIISPSAHLGENNVISAGVVIGTMAQIGDNNRISSHCTIEHHSLAGSHNFFGAHCVTGGAVVIKDNCVFGLGSIIDSLLTIGNGVKVANGGMVASDVPDGSVIDA